MIAVPPARPTVSDAALVAASVRLRIEDPDGRSCGTGTIIDARQGEALILDLWAPIPRFQGQGPHRGRSVWPRRPRTCSRRIDLVSILTRDVGLVKIHAPGQVMVARVAPPGYRVGPGQSVITVGCNNGDDPTVQHSRVLSVDKFMGPPNLQIDGEPAEGRSGGGVFSSDGLVIGICNAADRNDHAAYCAALATIQAEMDDARLSSFYKDEPRRGRGIGRSGRRRVGHPIEAGIPDSIKRFLAAERADSAERDFGRRRRKEIVGR